MTKRRVHQLSPAERAEIQWYQEKLLYCPLCGTMADAVMVCLFTREGEVTCKHHGRIRVELSDDGKLANVATVPEAFSVASAAASETATVPTAAARER